MSANSPSARELAARLLPLLDLTSLGDDDTTAQIDALCATALVSAIAPAAVCVYPEQVASARRALRGSAIKVATVVNFPDGGSDVARITRETHRALGAGADEIDLVFPYRAFCQGEIVLATAGINACRAACGNGVTLKLILETYTLGSEALIRQACVLGLRAGVNFLKTSTGKAGGGATLEAAAVMLDEIAQAGGDCGFKTAGGIRNLAQAARYLDLAQSRLGAAWIDPAHFRIGASSLFTELNAALGTPA